MREGNKLIEISNVKAGYHNEIAVQNINMSVFENDFIGIIGPNGGGKTTLVKLILGLIKPIAGEVRYFFDESQSKTHVGYLPQFNDIDKKFPISVKDVILSGFMNSKNITKRFTKTEKSIADKLMLKLGIFDLRKKPIGELSGGEMQRVFLGRSIISNPKLLILDEPNTYVDNQFEYELYNLLVELNNKMAIIIVSHDVGTISSYIKTIVCVNKDVHYHQSNIISQEQLKSYNCPIQLITHGEVPHTVLPNHHH